VSADDKSRRRVRLRGRRRGSVLTIPVVIFDDEVMGDPPLVPKRQSELVRALLSFPD